MNAVPFSAERLAALGRLSREINAITAPPPFADGIEVDDDGRVSVPVPGAPPALLVMLDGAPTHIGPACQVSVKLHAGLTLQWAPMRDQGGVMVDLRGGLPDGDAHRDAVAVFLTAVGLRAFAADLVAIATTVER